MSITQIEKLATGIPGFELISYGGVPKGRTTLITGRSGTGKSILALQVCAHLARRGLKTLFVAVEETPEDLITTGESFGFGVAELVRKGQLQIADLTPPREGPTFVSGDYDISGLIHRIAASVREGKIEVVALDSVTALFSPRPPDETLRSHFFQLVHALRSMGVTALITAEASTREGQLTSLGVEDYVCDLVVVLRNQADGERRRRSIEIHKYRRSPHYKGEYPATITPRGMTIFPLDAQDRTAGEERELFRMHRFSSGMGGLDEMNSGGWLRDSIVLVRGPSGSGKTTMAGMYARAGASRGERVMYWGFEETRSILLRNFASLGMPMEEFIEQGVMRMHCKYPEATSPEDLLVELRMGLDEYRPSLIVLDSISSIEHSTSPNGFRRFMIGMAALFREHGRSALLTQTTARAVESDAAPYLSTVADAILLLDYDTKTPEMERSIRVMKMRGSSHSTEARKLLIRPGGLAVLPMQGSTGGAMNRNARGES